MVKENQTPRVVLAIGTRAYGNPFACLFPYARKNTRFFTHSESDIMKGKSQYGVTIRKCPLVGIQEKRATKFSLDVAIRSRLRLSVCRVIPQNVRWTAFVGLSIVLFRGEYRARTDDLLHAMQAL